MILMRKLFSAVPSSVINAVRHPAGHLCLLSPPPTVCVFECVGDDVCSLDVMIDRELQCLQCVCVYVMWPL